MSLMSPAILGDQASENLETYTMKDEMSTTNNFIKWWKCRVCGESDLENPSSRLTLAMGAAPAAADESPRALHTEGRRRGAEEGCWVQKRVRREDPRACPRADDVKARQGTNARRRASMLGSEEGRCDKNVKYEGVKCPNKIFSAVVKQEEAGPGGRVMIPS